jgi:hypothetical protein
MYLFTRSGRLSNGSAAEAYAWAVGITERVNQIVEFPVGLYESVFSPGVGTLGWSTFAPDLTALEASFAKLAVDDGYLAEADRGLQFITGGLDDALAQVVYGAPDPDRDVQYVGVVSTVIAPGNFARGMELGVEIATRSSAVTGIDGLFVALSSGSFGAVAWIDGYSSIGELEAASAAMASDPDWVKFLDSEVTGVYTSAPGATTQMLYRRLV